MRPQKGACTPKNPKHTETMSLSLKLTSTLFPRKNPINNAKRGEEGGGEGRR